MAKRNTVGEITNGIPSGQVEPNKNGLISFEQIDGGKELYNKVNLLVNQIAQYGLETGLYRKNDTKILEQDLDPSLTIKINYLLNALDNFKILSEGIEFNGENYSIEEVLNRVLEKWSQIIEDDLYTKVDRI